MSGIYGVSLIHQTEMNFAYKSNYEACVLKEKSERI